MCSFSRDNQLRRNHAFWKDVYIVNQHVSGVSYGEDNDELCFPCADGTNSFCHLHFIELLHYIYMIHIFNHMNLHTQLCALALEAV